MKTNLKSYFNRKNSNELYNEMFKKYYDCLSDGFSEEESYNQAISILNSSKISK